MPKEIIRILLMSDFNIDVLRAYLQNSPMALGDVLTAPFGQVVPILIDQNHPCWTPELHCVMIWTQPEKIIPAFADVLRFKRVPLSIILGEVHHFADLIAAAQEKAQLFLIPSWEIPSNFRGYGVLDMRDPLGVRYILAQMNMVMAQRLSQIKNAYFLDSRSWLSSAGEHAFNLSLWYLSKIPFSQEVFKKASADILAILSNAYGDAKKIIIVDLDETLWGGILGEVGWQNIRLGGHDPLGEAFCDFQQALKSFRDRGILLAVISKNDEALVREAFMRRPEMILKIEDFSALRINWKDKAENLMDLTQELNLGLASCVFIDDSPAERLRIKEALPEVFVPQWPEDKLLYKKTLMELSCFDTLAITNEDLGRSELYAHQKERRDLKESLGSVAQWIKTLDIKVIAQRLNEADLPRATQLLNKTNQMNLTTRRMLEKDFYGWASQEGHFVWTLRVADKFGDYGLTGIVSLAVSDTVGNVCDFVLSCRVIGRKIEELMLGIVIEQAQKAGIKELLAQYIPTDRNKPCLEFFNSLNFKCQENLFSWDMKNSYSYPEEVSFTRK